VTTSEETTSEETEAVLACDIAQYRKAKVLNGTSVSLGWAISQCSLFPGEGY
jgi:hypothetical protein